VTFARRGLFRRVSRLALAAVALFACGSRTGLDVPRASAEAGLLADALAPLDGAPMECSDGGPLERSYLLDGSGVLYRYDALTAHVTMLGVPDCGNDNVQWTMTASRDNAYIVYTDWTLYAVSLTTLACTPTAFQPGQLGLDGEFGVAISESGGAESLYVYGQPSGGGDPILAVADLASFALTKVGDIVPVPPASSFPVNLTADTMGHLYAFSPGGLLQQIDAATGAVLRAAQTGVTSMFTWASLTYGSDVFLFVDSHVDGYDLASGTSTSDRDIGIFPIGGGSVLACPGM
jgi:hypothetical protein